MRSIIYTIAIAASCAAIFSACKKEKKDDRTILLADVPGAVLKLESVFNNDIDINTPYDTTVTLSWTQPSFGAGIIVGHELQFANTEAALGGTSSAFSYVLPAAADMFTVVDKAVMGEFAKLAVSGASSDVFIRVKSYPQNNPKAGFTYSNVQKLTWNRVAPIVPFDGKLFLTGNGGPGWTNPVPAPLWQLNRTSSTFYNIRTTLQGAKEFVLLPENGSWDTKYCLTEPDFEMPGIEENGTFVQRITGGKNFKTPAASGLYNLAFDFESMSYTITPSYDSAIPPQPTALYIVGDGTPESWTNTPSAAQLCTRISCNVFAYEGIFEPNKAVKFLPIQGAWQPQYGGKAGTMGYAAASGDPEPDAIPTPATAGKYRIVMNFYEGTYSWTLIP